MFLLAFLFATGHVRFDGDGVAWTRELFTSYPDRVLAMRLTASKKGALAFTVRPGRQVRREADSMGRNS